MFLEIICFCVAVLKGKLISLRTKNRSSATEDDTSDFYASQQKISQNLTNLYAINSGFRKFSADYREIASIIFLCWRAISGEQATECCLKAGGSKKENLQKRKQYSKRKPRPKMHTPLRGR